MKQELERCAFCDDPTGKAGRAPENSLWLETDDIEIGPFCGECWSQAADVFCEALESEAGKLRKRVFDLEAENERLAAIADKRDKTADGAVPKYMTVVDMPPNRHPWLVLKDGVAVVLPADAVPWESEILVLPAVSAIPHARHHEQG